MLRSRSTRSARARGVGGASGWRLPVIVSLGACTPASAPRETPPPEASGLAPATAAATTATEATPTAPATTAATAATAASTATAAAAASETATSGPRGAAAGELEIVARVVDAGPIGDGKCTQRSYKVEVIATLRGGALASPSWVHFERCAGAAAGAFEGSGLKVGARYRFVLARGASANFGRDPMIVGAELQGGAGP